MGSKNISLREEVYDELEREKTEDESFSDVVSRLLGVRHDEHPLYGLVDILNDEETEKVKEEVNEFRSDISDEMEATREDI